MNFLSYYNIKDSIEKVSFCGKTWEVVHHWFCVPEESKHYALIGNKNLSSWLRHCADVIMLVLRMHSISLYLKEACIEKKACLPFLVVAQQVHIQRLELEKNILISRVAAFIHSFIHFQTRTQCGL